VGILRTVSKVGRDTRFITFEDALRVLQRSAENLPPQLQLDSARVLAQERLQILNAFLSAAKSENVAGQTYRS